MRALALLLLACGAARAGGFVELQGPVRLCASETRLERRFHLDAPCEASLSVRKLSGLTRENKGEALLWLDDALIGPLRVEHDGAYVNPRPIRLEAGDHVFTLECGADAFSLEGLRLACPDSSTDRPRGLDGGASLDPPHHPNPAAEAWNPCPDLKPNPAWPGDPRRGILLSVVKGRDVSSPLLFTLKRGQSKRLYFKIGERPSGELRIHPPIQLKCQRRSDGRWQLRFELDRDELKRAEAEIGRGKLYTPQGYRIGRWTPLDMAWCADGAWKLSLNEGELRSGFSVDDAEMPLEIQAAEIELQIRGLNH